MDIAAGVEDPALPKAEEARLMTEPTLPPRLHTFQRRWRCWLFGECFGRWRQRDAWWQVLTCIWCESDLDFRKRKVAHCGVCNQDVPAEDADGSPAPSSSG